MSSNALILDWINNDLKLEPKVINISKEFSNGIRFAEVLYALNEINSKELEEFKTTNESRDIKLYFKKIKTYLQEKLNLEIRDEEFDDIIKNDVTKATIVLYKIKNSVMKKNINFLNIKTFSDQATKEDINKKVKEILDNEIEEEIEKDVDENDKINEKTRQYIQRISQKSLNLQSIDSDSNDKDADNDKKININKTNFGNINTNYSNMTKKLKTNILTNYKTINSNKSFESKLENKLVFNTMETMETNNVNSKKKLKPFTSNFNFKTLSSNNNQNILPKILPKININNTNYEYASSIMNSNIGKLTNYSIFNEQLRLNKLQKTLTINESDFNNDYGMTKIKEKQNKIILKQKLEKLKNSEEMKNELKLKREYEIKEKYQLDFVNKIKNPLYKFTKFTGVNLFMKANNKYNSCSKRLEYSKELQSRKHKEESDKQFSLIKRTMNSNTETINPNVKGKYGKFNLNLNLYDNNKVPFNRKHYFKTLNKVNKDNFNKLLIKKINRNKEDYPIIKNLLYSIIDLMEDIADYQEETEKDIIDLEDFKMFSDSFINNRHKPKDMIDLEELQLKRVDSLDNINIRKIDVNSLNLTKDDTYLIDDYINYIGIWSDDKIYNNELKGYKFDIKTIKADLPFEYEPTEEDIEDTTLPTKISDNYTFGNTILNLIDTKYSNNKENELLRESNSKEKENTNLSKWNYIPYKLSFIGYPLSGRKFIAEILKTKYPNLKIYSIKKIFRDYYIEYKNLTEDIDNNPKYKSLKPNQIAQMKEEREKQLSEFTPILDIIKPFIDHLKEEKIRKRLEEERIKREKEKQTNENKPKRIKSPVKRGSISKPKKIVDVPEVKEENINDDLKKIPSDEVLFNLLKYQIEKDFPKKTKEEENNEIIENQKKIFQIITNIENVKKQKKEAAKPNPKDDVTLNNLQKDLDNIKNDSIKGFMLVDYPSNVNQSVLLESYLTGYVDEFKKPKSEKNIAINNLSNLLDFKILPKKNNVYKRAGIDFVINIISQEKDINERFQTKKYDPVTDKIYTNSDLSDENKNKQPLDKKIIERLVDDVPYLNNENFDFYKDEYNTNISLISSLYNKFGMYVEINSAQDEINILGMDISEKELKKTFQSIELDTNNHSNNDNTTQIKKIEAAKRSSISIKRKSIKILKKNDNPNPETTISTLSPFELEEKNKNKIIDFISNNIINWLYKEKDKSDKIIFYSHHPEYNTDEENDRINFDPDLKVNEINNDKGKKTFKPQNNNSSMLMGESRITALLNKNGDYVIKDLINFNEKYCKYIGRFIYLINIQKNKIHKRLNLYQKKFRDYLNRQSNKKKVIHLYVTKYNEFFRDKKIFFQSPKAIEEFSQDIEEVNNNLWILINEKQKESVQELDDIKNSGFIERELQNFYENIQELFLIETEKFIKMANSIIYLYSNNTTKNNINKKDDMSINKQNVIKKVNKNKKRDFNFSGHNDYDRDTNLINEIDFDKNFVIKDIFTINFDKREITNSFSNTSNNNTKNHPFLSRKESKSEMIVNNIISQISNNIEIMFLNSIKLILEYQDIIEKLTKEIRSTSTINYKKTFKRKVTRYNISSNNSSMMTSMYGGESQINDTIIKMLQNEKNRYKYRMCYLKSFVYKYMAIITQTTQNIYNNLDQWIVTSVSLQNDALNMIISILKNKLNDHRLINEKKEINKIEMDEFEKIIDENSEGAGSEIRLKPIDNSSVGIGRIYNKINIDYLINDNFIDIKVEEIINLTQNEDNNKYKFIKNEKNEKNENKRYKMILPNELDRSINSSINNSFGLGLKYRLKDYDFYYDINKFNHIYKNIKKYEIEENIISKDLFYEVFIKDNIIDRYSENENEIVNINLSRNTNHINKINNNRNEIHEINESEDEDNENKIYNNENLINNQNNIHNLTGICTALKMLNTKQLNKIYNLYQISVEHKTPTNKENTIEEDKDKDKDSSINDNDNKENNENDNNEEKKIEYEIYLNTSEIFTILPLIGCRILNLIEEEHLFNDLKGKLIRGKYLLKKDFMEYNFWFEQELEYQNEDIMFQQILEENNNSNFNHSGRKNRKSTNKIFEIKKITIKEFLFNIWKDEKGDKMNFQKFISVLKINKYITDLNGLNEENYYYLIFKNEN